MQQNEHDAKKAGELLKQFVDESRLTQERIVQRTGLSMMMLWRLFNGQAKLTASRLALIAKACRFPQEKISAIESALNAPPRNPAISEASEAFGAFISKMRRRGRGNISMEALASACHLSRPNFSLIENGKTVPNPATAARIAEQLELSSAEQSLFFQLYGRTLAHHSDLSRSVSSPALVAMLEWSILAYSLSRNCKVTVGAASQEVIDEVLPSNKAGAEILIETLRQSKNPRPHAFVDCGPNGSYLYVPLMIKIEPAGRKTTK